MKYSLSNIILSLFCFSLVLLQSCDADIKSYKKWHTIELSFKGPETSETDADNPFLNYRLSVVFKNKAEKYLVRGFYAADGNAAETSADKGAVWRVRFTPDQLGEWSYEAMLHYGDSIALDDTPNKGKLIALKNNKGQFLVTDSDKKSPDFRANGRLLTHKGFYKFKDSDEYWIKGGTNSPENLLAYVDFDGTHRIIASKREGEANTGNEIHKYEAHEKDWELGDPTWKEDKGKGIIGAINYLSSKGMNAAYFLTMNISGDGNDVWPYITPNDFTRFDVSKLEQWNILFSHMQSKGIMLHIVLQETENETMLDNGDTNSTRQLYLRELIARFGHHLAISWNLGEENGPAPWSPIGQNNHQRKMMSKFLKENDPYKHPVLLHTHAQDPLRSQILDSILGFQYLDGLSLQQEERALAPEVVTTWKTKAKKQGQDWLITMDEIGLWHSGALPDSVDSNHDSLRHYVLWGTMMSGAAGVEWYFGAKHPHNDLNSEDWRQRDRLWELTNYATNFFEEYLPYWEMEPEHSLINSENSYCLRKKGELYALYIPKIDNTTINLNGVSGTFNVSWYNPQEGGALQKGSVTVLKGGEIVNIGTPNAYKIEGKQHDWVCLIQKTTN